MKKTNLFSYAIISAVLLLVLLLCCSCSSNEPQFEDKVKVTYYLEGGIYQNCSDPIIQYYDFEADTKNFICAPDVLSKKEITRQNYIFEGWYRTRTETSDGVVSYGDPWDFSKDTVSDNGVTLYAKWSPAVKYQWEVCYKDEQGNICSLGFYDASPGTEFLDFKKLARNRLNYTPVKFTDENGNALLPHPGGDTDTTVRVLVEYISGNYELVYSQRDLVRAKNSNIYLMNDIDFGGDKFGGFGDYKGIIEGNGYSIKNFVLDYDSTKSGIQSDPEISDSASLLAISLFKSLSGAKINNISFEDFTIDIATGYSAVGAIVVSPFAMKAENSSLSSVNIKCKISVGTLPESFNQKDNLVIFDDDFWKIDKNGNASDEGSKLDVEISQPSDEASD